ncbi:hypothetical protein ACMYSQ_004901 [Aspergillus niger]
MSSFGYLCHFQTDNGDEFFANSSSTSPVIGSSVTAYPTYEELVQGQSSTTATIAKLLPPLPPTNNSIYCVGLNYRSHAKEANLNVPANPPVWTKPPAALASPDETIPISRFCASHLPDWEASHAQLRLLSMYPSLTNTGRARLRHLPRVPRHHARAGLAVHPRLYSRE